MWKKWFLDIVDVITLKTWFLDIGMGAGSQRSRYYTFFIDRK